MTHNHNEKRIKSLFISLMIIAVSGMILPGCGAQEGSDNMFNLGNSTQYKVNYDGYGFDSKKTTYAEGETVTVYYRLIATDTDYSFSTDCDDVVLQQSYDVSQGYIFTFTMPAHDVTLSVSSRNTMVRDAGYTIPEEQVQDGFIGMMWDRSKCGEERK